MFRKDPCALMRGAVVASVVAGAAVFAAPAIADCSTTTAGAGCGTTVTGTAQGELSLSVATPAAMLLVPGASTTGLDNNTTSVVTALDTSSATPSISVSDTASSNPGFLKLVSGTPPTCTSSTTESKLNHPLNLASLTSVVGWTDAGNLPHDLGGTTSAVTLANSTLPVASGSFTLNLKQPVDSTEGLLSGCVYTATATYTIQ